MSRIATFGLCNFSALAVAILHSYRTNGSFYASCVYFAQSRLSMIILGTWGLYCLFLLASAVKRFFFGSLRLIEVEHITEYGWITLSETFLAMTIFKSDIESTFIFSFALLLTAKVFHWIARDRIEFMEQTLQLPASLIPKLATLLGLLLVYDAFMVTVNVVSVLRRGPSMAILFANEYALTAISAVGSSVRFALNCIDARGEPYEHRSTTLFYTEFAVDLVKLLVYSAFFVIVMYYYGLPIHIIRDMYVTVLSFTRRVRDMINYRQVMASIETRYPDVLPEDLVDRTCIICREEMKDVAKRLFCGHVFHLRCIKSWLERQQVCPTCRKSVFARDESARDESSRELGHEDRHEPANSRPSTPRSPVLVPVVDASGESATPQLAVYQVPHASGVRVVPSQTIDTELMRMREQSMHSGQSVSAQLRLLLAEHQALLTRHQALLHSVERIIQDHAHAEPHAQDHTQDPHDPRDEKEPLRE